MTVQCWWHGCCVDGRACRACAAVRLSQGASGSQECRRARLEWSLGKWRSRHSDEKIGAQRWLTRPPLAAIQSLKRHRVCTPPDAGRTFVPSVTVLRCKTFLY